MISTEHPILCYVTDRTSLPLSLASPLAGAAETSAETLSETAAQTPATGAIVSLAAGSREQLLVERIRVAAAAGIDWIELREKDMESRALLALASVASLAMRPATGTSLSPRLTGAGSAPRHTDTSLAARLTGASLSARLTGAGAATKLFVNDRLDVAIAAGADGVHLNEASMPVRTVTAWRRGTNLASFVVGASCHSLDGAQRAADQGADYVFFGPVFATPSKAAYGAPQGLEKLAAVCRAVKIPVIAVGGIALVNAASCRTAGAAGIAAIGMFQRAADQTELIGALRWELR